ncbi:MAG: asparagine synthase-related protein [Humidesulfovibrio sp.]|uniref:asparagine synthase-related protein n=1 Tax=Humidesulfovibrio sp. TaxID=2910988 RepID=UPI0027ED4FD4|nr:asparagine synthase-related protein [Humidesulfovibrio sp.]MDQ7835061.1 asparagine synthase-related protein [Humidesulfovibrio sp.]
MDARLASLIDSFRATGTERPVAVAFSGGVDSSLVLWAASSALGRNAVGVTVRSEFVCSAERDRADRLAAFLGRERGAHVLVRGISALADADLRANTAERCYLCKRHVLAEIRQAAADHFRTDAALAEGTNADDDPARPGRRAVAEAGAQSPLAACGITKAEVRELARMVGLPNAEDPSNSCLATRVPEGHELTFKRLTCIEAFERTARELGLEDLRARLSPGSENGAKNGADGVRLLVRPAQLLLAQSLAARLEERARFIGFSSFQLGERT